MRLQAIIGMGLLLLFGGRSPADAGEPKKTAGPIDGSYQVRFLSRGGKAEPAEQLKVVTEVVIADGKFVIRQPNKDDATTFKIDPSQSPAHFDLEVPGQPGVRHAGVYKMEKDRLTIVWSVGGDRPASLEGNGERQLKFELLRTGDGVVPPDAADVVRPGEFEGVWHDRVKFSIQQVHHNGTFDGIAEITGGRFAGLKFGISGRVGKDHSLTITRHVQGEAQVAQTTAPRTNDDGSRAWAGGINGIGLPPGGVSPFRLVMPKP